MYIHCCCERSKPYNRIVRQSHTPDGEGNICVIPAWADRRQCCREFTEVGLFQSLCCPQLQYDFCKDLASAVTLWIRLQSGENIVLTLALLFHREINLTLQGVFIVFISGSNLLLRPDAACHAYVSDKQHMRCGVLHGSLISVTM